MKLYVSDYSTHTVPKLGAKKTKTLRSPRRGLRVALDTSAPTHLPPPPRGGIDAIGDVFGLFFFKKPKPHFLNKKNTH